MNKVCAKEGQPGRSTVFRWLIEDEAFRDMYARACEERREVRKEQLFDIPLDESIEPSRGKMLSDNIKWVLAKEEPRKWGDKTMLADADGNNLPPTTILFAPIAAKSDESQD